jgi:RNA polymerase sigma factor (sigma-70 family)
MEEWIPLIQHAQTGDADAYGVVVTRFQDMAYGYAYAILGDFDLAQDAAQEAFVEAYQCLPTLREALAFPAWFKRIIFKHCDRLTRQRDFAHAPLENILEWASPLPGPHEIAERNEFASRVQAAIRDLPANQRMATTLFYINGYSHQEIADFLEVPAKTIKSRLHASRQRLKERMLDMIQEELAANALPGDFAQETVEQAVARAAALNQEHKFDQAENLLRGVLAQASDHPAVLKELNRTLMRGRVYGQGRWDLLVELAVQGKRILQTTDDDDIHRQVAQTLLAIPAMREAVAFLEAWISRKGSNLERLGMLAWAKGCLADYAAAEALWQDVYDLAEGLPPQEALAHLPFAAYTLVDCFSEADKLPTAQHIARQAWNLCGLLGPLPPQGTFADDSDWLVLWRQAKLDEKEIIETLLARHQPQQDAQSQAVHLALRTWVDDPELVRANWMAWVQARIAAKEWPLLEKFRFPMLRGFRARGLWREANQLAGKIWEMLGDVHADDAEKVRTPWDWERFNPWMAIADQDWAAAQDLARQEIAARGVQGAVGSAAIAFAGNGAPTPPEIMQAIAQDGVSGVDEYGMFGWYLVAREAAAAGDSAKAFDALRKSLAYWSNSPYWGTNIWEKDPSWGELRNHPEFQRTFDERRQRIGPIYGLLHYFPGW